jgi:hypothetical protein
MDRPYTLEQIEILHVPGTEECAHFFWHVDTRRPGETMRSICDAHGIGVATGYRWRREPSTLAMGDVYASVKLLKRATSSATHGAAQRSSWSVCSTTTITQCATLRSKYNNE